jgi:hypothetical protein
VTFFLLPTAYAVVERRAARRSARQAVRELRAEPEISA